MDFRLLSSLYKDLSTDNFCFFYRGEFSDQITSQLFAISEAKLGDGREMTTVRKKVNFLMVECIQNIERHGVENTDVDTSLGYFSLRSRDNAFYLTSANIIHSGVINHLTETLNHVNELSEEELKGLYMQVLGQGELSEKGGAGLGIIEMARKSGNKLDYEFVTLNADLCYFYLQLSIAAIKGELVEPLPVKDALRYHKVLLDHEILFLYYGHFNNETIKPIAYTLEQNLTRTGNVAKSKLMFHVLIELMQNISKYSLEEEDNRHGMFGITLEGEGFNIVSANLVSEKSRDKLCEILDKVNSVSRVELDELYRQELLNDDEESSAGIGFIDIVRNTGKIIDYTFNPVGNNILYQVKVSV
jgi:hypothetical protein